MILHNVLLSKPVDTSLRPGDKMPRRMLSPSQRLAFRAAWFNAKERAYDLWQLVFPIFLVVGCIAGAARFWARIFWGV